MKTMMAKVRYSALIGCFVGCVVVAAPAREIEELAVYYKKEVLGGKAFVYREDVANGVKKEAWTVDGKPVDSQEYEEALLDAEKEVRREERRVAEEYRKRHQQARLSSSFQLQKKLLRLQIEQVEVVLKRFDHHRLTPFLSFDKEKTLSQEDFEHIDQALLDQAKKLLYTADQEIDLPTLATMIEKFDMLPTRLQDLFHATVNNAIKRCDDTKVLKELLGVLSPS